MEVSKNNIIVRLHYFNADANVSGDPEPRTIKAWNILVAPRFTSLSNFKVVSPSLDWQRAYLGSGNLKTLNGDNVFVAIFQKASNDWIEIEVPSKNVFVTEFGFDPDALTWDTDSRIWDKLLRLAGYNKFAVGENDLEGKWSSDFSSSMQYYNVYSGMYAGYSAYQSNQTFQFKGRNFDWNLVTVQNTNMHTNAQQAKSSGQFKFNNNWQLFFSEIERRPKNYDVYFSAVRGGRMLWMKDVEYGGYSAYGKVKE